MKPYIIGETAYHHEGDFEYLKKMILDIGEMNLNAVKFHLLFNLDSYFQKQHPLYKHIEKWMFSQKQWNEAFEISKENNLDVIALCDDIESIQYINKEHKDIKAIEIHSSSLNEYYMLKEALKFENLIILGIGGSTLDEVDFAVNFLKKNGKKNIWLMYGFQSYPTRYEDVNLSKILKIRDLFDVPVGYADHTSFDDKNNVDISAIAAAMGIYVLEKHYTPNMGQKRLDYHAAVGKEQMKAIQIKMELYLKVFGDGMLELSQLERQYGNVGPMKKAVVAKRNIKKGERLSLENLCFKRTKREGSIMQKDFLGLIGLEALVNIKEDEMIDYSKVKYKFHQKSYSNLTGGLEEIQ
ncbi:N-acetylneuraminate synthase family protein [Inediibacterium massiliense]|uniref:N-acetylneuraminate synthase family protein n=1 Tax=Inediibacterium massiliense TaxID=1658111 RepID=UPI0006B6550D|nr:N-acetylneuraminate synthase family protein [Inediibacterium massiliense]